MEGGSGHRYGNFADGYIYVWSGDDAVSGRYYRGASVRRMEVEMLNFTFVLTSERFNYIIK